MARCENLDFCSFFQAKMIGMPSLVNMMKQSFCEKDKSSCARYMLREKMLKGYTLPEEDTLHLGDTFIGNLETLIENLYPNDHEKLERIMLHLIK